MSTVWIRKRQVGPSKRNPKPRTAHQVLYRTGGRDSEWHSAGTFPTIAEAKIRRDLVAGWLAGGIDPAEELLKLKAPKVRRTAGQAFDDWLEAHERSVKPNSNRLTAGAWGKKIIGTRDLESLTPADGNALAISNPKLKPRTVHIYMNVWRQALDDLGVEPNPLRHRSVKLPRIERKEKSPPVAAHVKAIAEQLPEEALLPFIVLEVTGMRVGELASLQWGDVDVPGAQFRVRSEEVKTARSRWVPLPDWLMVEVASICPIKQRTIEGEVFPEITERRLRAWMNAACIKAEVPHYSPKDLRDRRASLWHHQGVEWRAIANRLGQSKPSITLDVYSWSMTDATEVADTEWAKVLR